MAFLLNLAGNCFEENTTVVDDCLENNTHYDTYQYLFIPSVIVTLMLSFTWQRQNKYPTTLKGRPALVYPMDIMSHSNRFSFAVAFGSMSSVFLGMLDGKHVIEYDGPSYGSMFVMMLSVVIYGIDFMPLFTGMAVRTPLGYAVGSLYAWMFFGLKIQIFRCGMSSIGGESFFLYAPELVCLTYLSISLPVRCVQRTYIIIKKSASDELEHTGFHRTFALPSIRRILTRLVLRTNDDLQSMKSKLRKIAKSYYSRRVRTLLRKTAQPPTANEGRILSAIVRVLRRLSYYSHPDFRYSGRYLSVVVVCIIIIYTLTVQTVILGRQLFNFYVQCVRAKYTGQLLILLDELVYGFKCCLIVSVVLTCVFGVIMLSRSMIAYRDDLLAAYTGKLENVLPKKNRANSTLLIGCMRYTGYQVGYTAWGFIIQFLLCFMLTYIMACIIIVVQWDTDIWKYVLDKLNTIWPTLLVTATVYITQRLLVRFFFLQYKSYSLAIDNRRAFFIVVYFMFFYNVFLGLMSCLGRIMESIVIGALFMARLDKPTLPTQFEPYDKGFSAYVGLIYTENVHAHPVLIIFVRLLIAMKEGKSRNSYSISEIEAAGSSPECKARIRKTRARNKWMVLYTLHKNPQLQCLRKKYLDEVKHSIIY
ncbi:hypothetical protein ScPMuIL_017990 [Solemya velum]